MTKIKFNLVDKQQYFEKLLQLFGDTDDSLCKNMEADKDNEGQQKDLHHR